MTRTATESECWYKYRTVFYLRYDSAHQDFVIPNKNYRILRHPEQIGSLQLMFFKIYSSHGKTTTLWLCLRLSAAITRKNILHAYSCVIFSGMWLSWLSGMYWNLYLSYQKSMKFFAIEKERNEKNVEMSNVSKIYICSMYNLNNRFLCFQTK